jgi:hypothetical protein
MRDGRSSAQEEGYYLQLEEGQVRVAVVCLVLALLHHVVLEDSRCLGVVAVEAIEDQVDVLGPLRREVERDAHDVLMAVRRGRERLELRCAVAEFCVRLHKGRTSHGGARHTAHHAWPKVFMRWSW